MKRLIFALIVSSALIPSVALADLRVATGSYVGDGSDNRNITVSPSFVIKYVQIKRSDASATADVGGAQASISGMGDNAAEAYQNAVLQSNVIQSMGTGTFQVGTSAGSNAAGKTYYWFVLGGDDTEVKVGTYTGNGGTQSITGVGFAPGMVVMIKPNANTTPVGRWGTTGTDFNWYTGGQAVNAVSTGINSLDADGFTVGSRGEVNTNGVLYYYCVVRTVAGHSKAGTYTGTGSSLGVTGVGFQPDVVSLDRGDNGGGVGGNSAPSFRSTANTGDDTSANNDNSANYTGGVTSLDTGGFTLGTSARVNANTVVGYYMAFKDTPAIVPSIPFLGLVRSFWLW